MNVPETRIVGGLAQFTIPAIGAAAGNVTATGVKTTDKLIAVHSIAFTAGVPSAVADLTSEFTITAANTINNAGGTSTADMIVLVQVARQVA